MRYFILAFGMFLCTNVYAISLTAQGGWEHTSNSNYGDGGTATARIEQSVLGDLSLGAEYNYHGQMDHGNGNDAEPIDYGDVSGHSVLADLLYRPSQLVFGRLHPYVVGGLGWSWWDFTPSDQTNSLGIEAKLGDAFCYKAGAGVDYEINERWSLNVEWSFFKAKIPVDAFNPDGSRSILLGDDAGSGRVRLGEEETRVVGGIRYNF